MTCPGSHSRSAAKPEFTRDPLFSEPTLLTVTLLQSPFPSPRVEIAVYPVFYEQVSNEASRMCVIKPANSKIQLLLRNLVLASHPPAWL